MMALLASVLVAALPPEPAITVTTASFSGRTFWIGCLGLLNRPIWMLPHRESYSYAAISPTGKVIALPSLNSLICVSRLGKLLWSLPLTELNEPASLLVSDRYVYVGRGTITSSALSAYEIDQEFRVECREVLTGRRVWSAPTRDFGKPIAITKESLIITFNRETSTLALWIEATRKVVKTWNVCPKVFLVLDSLGTNPKVTVGGRTDLKLVLRFVPRDIPKPLAHAKVVELGWHSTKAVLQQ